MVDEVTVSLGWSMVSMKNQQVLKLEAEENYNCLLIIVFVVHKNLDNHLGFKLECEFKTAEIFIAIFYSKYVQQN
jgi:hypothetical protein